jgi:ATP-binding cassette subfamily B protein
MARFIFPASDNGKPALSLKEQYAALGNLPRFFKMVWEVSPSYTLANILLRIVKSALPVSQLYVGKLLIDEIIRLIGQEAAEFTYLFTLVAIELAIVVLSDILSRAVGLIDSLLGGLFGNASSVALIEHATRLDLYKFEDATFYDKLERARQQTNSRIVLLSQVFTQFQDLVTMTFLIIGLVSFNAWLLLLMAVAVIPGFITESYYSKESYSLNRSWTPQRRELDYLRYIGASNETAREIKAFSLGTFVTERFKEVATAYYQANKTLNIKRATWGGILAMVSTLSYYGAYLIMILQTVAGNISVGSLTFLAGSFEKMQNQLQQFLGRFTFITQNALYLQDLFDFLAIQPDFPQTTGLAKVTRPIQSGFVFENVGFRYYQSEKWSLRNVSFTLNKGEKLALVGENGAGKTTLIKLLTRLYEPTEGRILLDGRNLQEYDLEDLRGQIGVIFQDYVKFQLTVSENIAVGQINRIDDTDLIARSAQKSLADEVVAKLPEGYEQMLGKRFRKGVELSGGEWQKIALARAYMRDAQVMVLDEPTAALDARAEYEVFVRFSALMEGKTAVLISHRFSTVRMADRILYLENGQLKEIGSHHELMTQKGKYAELFELQARGYA